MKINFARFNTVLLLLAVVIVAGCATGKKKGKEATTFRVHLETSAKAPNDRSVSVEIGREGMFNILVDSQPFLDEGQVAKATVVKAMGGFQLMIEFNRQGSWILEQYTTAARGQRMAIYSQFGQARWLGAPRITHTIKDGVLTFTPDVSMEEAERIVKGLNTIAKEAQKNNP